MNLLRFIQESNAIEGLDHPVKAEEIEAHRKLLALPELRVADVENFVKVVAGASLRCHAGQNVQVGSHFPPPGGPEIDADLTRLLADIACSDLTPWEAHAAYETLHPFMDGNGRSGRAIWAWMRKREGRDPFNLGFLHSAYYEALESSR